MYLRTKQLIALVSVAVIPLVAVSLMGFSLTQSLLTKTISKEVSSFVESAIEEKYDDIDGFSSLVHQASEYPPVQGIIRAADTGFDPIDRSTTQEWEDRLAQLFDSVVRNSEGEVRQMRFIDENGMEVVNVIQDEGVVRRKLERELQNKSDAVYFAETMTLEQRKIYVGPIGLNEEFGKIELPYVPVFRVATPVFDERDGSREGIIVMNVLADKVFGRNAFNNDGDIAVRYILIDSEGRYLYAADPLDSFSYEIYGDTSTYFDEQPEIRQRLSELDNFSFTDRKDDRLRIWKKVWYAPQAPDRYYVLIAVIDENILFAPIMRMQITMVLIAAATFLMSLLLSAHLSRLLTTPILRIKEVVARAAGGSFDERIEETREDEIGELAHGVNQMSEDLKKSYAELERRVQLRTSELNALIENVPVAICFIDAASGKVSVANPRVKELLGEELDTSRSYLELIEQWAKREDGTPYPANELPSVKALADGGVHEANDIFIRRPDGSVRNLFERSAGIKGGGKVVGVVIALYDRTREYDIDKQRNNFVSFAAHQLKTPPQGILWAAQSILGDKKTKLSPSVRKDIRMIEEIGHSMLKTVQQFLNISRVELDTFGVEPEPTAVRTIIDEVLKNYEHETKEKSLRVAVRATKLQRMDADPGLLRAIVDNLVSNAIKYTPEKGKVSIAVETDPSSGIAISVADTGIGIPEADQARLFEKMYRASNVGDTEGTGFGMYLVREIVVKTGGTIAFTSEVGKGSTFTVTFPPEGMRPKQGTTKIG
jgi:signal transduction histidine kinase